VALDYKACTACGIAKTLDEFPSDSRNQCKACKSLGDKNRSNASVRGFLQLRLTSMRQRHRTKGYEGDVVSLDYLMKVYQRQRGYCAVSQLPMHLTTDQSDLSASPDRVDIKQGYIDGNVRLVCSRVNLMRSTLNDHDFVWWCRAVVNNSGN
jgi:hypothetical protein